MTSTLAPVLSIAGSDSSGGAGIQADLKTMLANGVFGMTAIAALTAQNTTGVTMVTNTPPEMLAAQIDAVFEDIPPVAVKIGMVSSVKLINVIADRLIAHDATNIVLDPVMVATSGAKLIEGDAIAALTSSCSRWPPSSRRICRKPRRCASWPSNRVPTRSTTRMAKASPVRTTW